jgi:hypothetical protein
MVCSCQVEQGAGLAGGWIDAEGLEEVPGQQRRARVGLGPTKKFSMGFIFDSAHKVFVKMAAREILLNFGNSFGGSHSYNQRGRMEVVVVKLVLICKVSNWG